MLLSTTIMKKLLNIHHFIMLKSLTCMLIVKATQINHITVNFNDNFQIPIRYIFRKVVWKVASLYESKKMSLFAFVKLFKMFEKFN